MRLHNLTKSEWQRVFDETDFLESVDSYGRTYTNRHASVRSRMSDWEFNELMVKVLRRYRRADGTTSEIAREAGVSERTVQRWARRNSLTYGQDVL